MSVVNKESSAAVVKASESAMIGITPETVKRFVNALATGEEVALFLNQCAMFGLNPFKREIYLIKYKSTEPATFVVGYETYLKRAERTEKWSGMESGTTDGPDGKPVSAWVKVYRKDWERPLYHEVFLEEYIQMKDEWVEGQRTGRKVPTRFWADKPRTMLKKVAIAQAFRMAFPDEMAGMPYISEERIAEPDKLPATHIEPERGTVKHVKDEFTDPESFKAPAEPKKKWDADAPGPGRGEEYGEDPGSHSDLTNPKVSPFSKPDPDVDIAAEGEALAAELGDELASPDQAQRIFDGVAAMTEMGIKEDMVWRSIAKKVMENYGKEFGEPSGLTQGEAKWVVDYLKRWFRAAKADAAKGGKK